MGDNANEATTLVECAQSSTFKFWSERTEAMFGLQKALLEIVPQLLGAAVVVKMALLKTARARALSSRHQDEKVSLVATLKGAEDSRGPLNGDPIFGSQVRIAQKQLLIDGPCDLCQEARPLHKATCNTRACVFVRSLSVLVSGACLCGCRRIANVGHPAAIGEVPHDLQSLVFRQTLLAGPIKEIATVVG